MHLPLFLSNSSIVVDLTFKEASLESTVDFMPCHIYEIPYTSGNIFLPHKLITSFSAILLAQ